MSDIELKAFLDWLNDRKKFHDELSDSDKRTDAFKLNHASRSLAFLEVQTELRHRLAEQKQAVLDSLQKAAVQP